LIPFWCLMPKGEKIKAKAIDGSAKIKAKAIDGSATT
jgi:hypothetical protein